MWTIRLLNAQFESFLEERKNKHFEVALNVIKMWISSNVHNLTWDLRIMQILEEMVLTLISVLGEFAMVVI